MDIAKPYLLFLGDVKDQLAAKTAQGVVDWRPDWCVGQTRLAGCKADCGLADMTIAEARAKGAKTMVVGVVNAGGVLPDHWVSKIVEALDQGLDVATGLHKRLGSIPEIAEAAKRNGRKLHDVRFTDMTFATGKGSKRQGLRLLAVKDITPLEGGLPVILDGKIIGSIGVSGALSSQDAQVARVGAAAVK